MNTVTDLPTLLKWIDTKRHHDGWTYAQLADQLGVSVSTATKWLTGKRKIPADKLLQLIHLMETQLILTRTTPTTPGRHT